MQKAVDILSKIRIPENVISWLIYKNSQACEHDDPNTTGLRCYTMLFGVLVYFVLADSSKILQS